MYSKRAVPIKTYVCFRSGLNFSKRFSRFLIFMQLKKKIRFYPQYAGQSNDRHVITGTGNTRRVRRVCTVPDVNVERKNTKTRALEIHGICSFTGGGFEDLFRTKIGWRHSMDDTCRVWIESKTRNDKLYFVVDWRSNIEKGSDGFSTLKIITVASNRVDQHTIDREIAERTTQNDFYKRLPCFINMSNDNGGHVVKNRVCVVSYFEFFPPLKEGCGENRFFGLPLTILTSNLKAFTTKDVLCTYIMKRGDLNWIFRRGI